MTGPKRQLRIFICHALPDKSSARELYQYLKQRKTLPWLDEENLIPGQIWKEETLKAIEDSNIIIICLSRKSVSTDGYVQREIRYALEKALEMPEGRIFLIPARLDECKIPDSLNTYQRVDLFGEDGYEKLMKALNVHKLQLQSTNTHTLVSNKAINKSVFNKRASKKPQGEQKHPKSKIHQQASEGKTEKSLSYLNQYVAISDMLSSPLPGKVSDAQDLLFDLWLDNDNEKDTNFYWDLKNLIEKHPILMQELENRLEKFYHDNPEVGPHHKKNMESLASEVLQINSPSQHTAEAISPVKIDTPEKTREKFTWWQFSAFAAILIGIVLTIALPLTYQKIVVFVVVVCSAITLLYILPRQNRMILTDLAGVKLNYTFPTYLSLGDENTVHIFFENPSQAEFNGKVTLIFDDPDSLVTPAPDQSLSVKIEVLPLSREAKQFKFFLLKKPSDGNLDYFFQISSNGVQYLSKKENFRIAPIPYLRSTWTWLFGSAGLGALILTLLWDQLKIFLGFK